MYIKISYQYELYHNYRFDKCHIDKHRKDNLKKKGVGVADTKLSLNKSEWISASYNEYLKLLLLKLQ